MTFPIELRTLIEGFAEKYKPSELKLSANKLSEAYLSKSRDGSSFISNEKDVLAYAIMRMPATYSANSEAIANSLSHINSKIETILDVGAGMGTASFAYCFNNENQVKITCVEREQSMIDLGKDLMRGYDSLNKTNWIKEDYTNYLPEGNFDLIIISYSLNELSEEKREKIVELLWKKANIALIIVDSGTPESSKMIKDIRNKMISEGAYVLAPCPHCSECKISDDDWCHFVTRVERSKLHKYLKDADVPYEDEKYSYIAFSKIQPINPINYRVMRHPIIGKGNIKLTVCGHDGIEEKRLFKNDPFFKPAKKAKAGDEL